MQSGTRRLEYRTRSKKRTYKLLKRGGAAGKEPVALSANTFTRHGIARYFTHSMILRDYFIPLTSGGCPAGVKIFFINKGFNGFILQFKCENDVKAIKILFNRSNPLSDRAEWEMHSRLSLSKEYANIRIFNESKFIINTYGYFIFDGREFKCSGIRPYDKTYDTPRSIEDPQYKVKQINGPAHVLEPFGGLILEYVNHSLNDIRAHLQSIKKENPKFYIDNIPQCVFTFIELFYQYLLGITHINSKGYVHTDIKVDNLMFEKDEHGYTAKIVDLANIKDINSSWDLTSNSKVKALDKQYHKGAIKRLIKLQTQGADLRSITALKLNYLQRYDLYCLCVTFHYILITIKADLFDFAEAIAEENKRKGKEPKDGPRPEKLKKLQIFKTAFEYFEREINTIKEIPIDGEEGERSLETIKPNTAVSAVILSECIRKMFPKYGL
jgi:serine/threonine protein kinase